MNHHFICINIWHGISFESGD